MKPELPPHVGPLTPRHRAGHCQWNPGLDGKDMCNAPASIHFWVGSPDGADGIDAWTSYACDDHWPTAYKLTHPIDFHPIDQACIESDTMWQWSTNERVGFCHRESEEEMQEVVSLELVTAGQTSPDIRPGENP